MSQQPIDCGAENRVPYVKCNGKQQRNNIKKSPSTTNRWIEAFVRLELWRSHIVGHSAAICHEFSTACIKYGKQISICFIERNLALNWIGTMLKIASALRLHVSGRSNWKLRKTPSILLNIETASLSFASRKGNFRWVGFCFEESTLKMDRTFGYDFLPPTALTRSHCFL